MSDRLIIETAHGTVTIKLRADLAPKHVEQITKLAKDGFYDGIIFHRVIPGFMAQTGDPTGTGTGGSGENLKAEFSQAPFKRGTCGMARSQHPDSASSQFFICFAPASHLNGQYTVWGEVIGGMDAIDKIAVGEPPRNPDKMLKVTVEETVE